MSQIFPPGSNSLAKLSVVAALTIVVGLLGVLWYSERSDYVTEVSVIRPQPIPFSHKHHVGEEGIDCRYCHYTVEKSAVAGVPPVSVCMNCHRQIWADNPMLAPVRDAYRTGRPIEWVRVHDNPDFVYFNHSIHVAKGVGCVTCHGRVDQMPLMYRVNTLQMQWCLSCHRNPERFVRPKDKVTAMDWKPTEDQSVMGPRLVREYHIQKLTNCYVCHR